MMRLALGAAAAWLAWRVLSNSRGTAATVSHIGQLLAVPPDELPPVPWGHG